MTFSALEDSGPQDVGKLILREAYKRIGISVNFLALPGRRTLVESNSGRTDGEVARIIGIENEYQNLVRVPIAISQLDGVAFVKKSGLVVGGWSSLKNYTIGAFSGSKFVEKNAVGMDVVYLPGAKNLFPMLESGRIDLIVIPYLSGLKFIKKNSLLGFKALAPSLTTTKLYHYLHKKHQKILPRLTEVLEIVARENRIQSIRDDYIAALKGE